VLRELTQVRKRLFNATIFTTTEFNRMKFWKFKKRASQIILKTLLPDIRRQSWAKVRRGSNGRVAEEFTGLYDSSQSKLFVLIKSSNMISLSRLGCRINSAVAFETATVTCRCISRLPTGCGNSEAMRSKFAHPPLR
jgi:hypothetical protein